MRKVVFGRCVVLCVNLVQMQYSLFLFALIFVFCKNETSDRQLIVRFSQISLLDAPGKKSKELRALRQGESVTDLNETSHFESFLVFQDQNSQSPWIKVRASDNSTGWVFADALRPARETDDWLLHKRLQCYFGSALTERRARYLDSDKPAGEDDFAGRYRETVALRDTMMYLLSRRAEPAEAGMSPDFSWLAAALPGFVFQYVAEGTQPYLFTDFRYWIQQAEGLNSEQVNTFLSACNTAFPRDSIESFFPAWKFQLTEYEAASQLGTGAHLKMLHRIEIALKKGTLFTPELNAFKEAVLDDVLNHKTVYWQSGELIRKELQQIIDSGLRILDARDRAALQARLLMFEDPEANGIRVDARSR